MEHIRYAVAACQTDLPNPVDRSEMRRNTDRIIQMIQCAVDGSAVTPSALKVLETTAARVMPPGSRRRLRMYILRR